MKIITIIIRGQQHIWRIKFESFQINLAANADINLKLTNYISSTSSHLGKNIVGRIHLGQESVAANSEKWLCH